jgi:carbonic anhydrase
MSNLSTPTTISHMIERGKIPADTLRTLQYSGIDLHKWLHGFDSVQESVRSSVDIIRNHPLVPRHVPVHGLIIDPNTGKLDLVVDGSITPAVVDAREAASHARPAATTTA